MSATKANGVAFDPANPACAVDLDECCRRIGISRRTGERLVATGEFPIPGLPLLGSRRTYSPYEIDLYLREASVRGVR